MLGYLGYPRLQGRGEHGIDRAGLGIYLWAVLVDHKRHCSSVHFLPGCPQSTRDTVLMALQESVNKSIKFNLLDNFSNDMSRSSYEAAFHRIKEYIAAGDCYQVNLTQRVSSRYSGDPLEAYLRLRQQGGKPFSAYLNWGDTALLSLSPERFLQVRGDHVVSQPIKGTRPRGATTAEDQKLREHLLCSEKDRAENLMIVDLLRNDLGMVCEYGSISAQPLFELQSFSNVHHLVSTIHGTLKKDANSLDLLKNCFPGGSVTGAPKLRAMEIIEELESEPRDVYCGTVFYLGFDGQMDSNITIRTLLCEAGDIHCWAGGGIVADSQCDQEYHECFDKISELINILQQ
ncbi:MAG: aminodeoxychorismate synthase component I [Gammaproteobacteria bacterium]|nr:aminodeoxychorismate synthase component I [Gammaproteobacteria bacterium]